MIVGEKRSDRGDYSGRPSRPVFRPENVPVELRRAPRWVCWSYTWSGGKKKWDKPPRRLDGRCASSIDSSTWCDFGSAVQAVCRRRFDGIGHVLVGNGLTALDLDDCVDKRRTGAVRCGDLAGVDAWARAIVTELEAYTELSPSGCGIRIFVRAALPAGCGSRRGSFEVYDRARFVSVTGDRIDGLPATIEGRQSALERVIARMLPTGTEPAAPRERSSVAIPDDDALLEKARQAKTGARFGALFDRGELSEFGDDHSRADLALCSMLAFWCGSDPERVDRLFRRSALYREKWDERHRRNGESYGQMTIAKAVRF